MRRIVLAAVALVMCATLAHSGSKAGLSWKHEGYKSLLAAAGEAKAGNQRLLVGLSGSFT